MTVPQPPNEQRRLKILWQYDVLDTVPEAVFDDLTELAAVVCDAPICLISLVDEHRQWFKSRVGLEATETPRNISFCAHAICQPGLFIVEDATKDRRFAKNPLVTSDPRIRFYAGAPLVTADGHALGTLCVIDRVARKLTAAQKQALTILARVVMTQLELRQRSSASSRSRPGTPRKTTRRKAAGKRAGAAAKPRAGARRVQKRASSRGRA